MSALRVLHLVDISPVWDGADPVADARAIMAELRKYDEALYQKPHWLVLNKVDMLDEAERESHVAAFRKEYVWDRPVFAISALTGGGCEKLTYAIQDNLETVVRPQTEIEPDAATEDDEGEAQSNKFKPDAPAGYLTSESPATFEARISNVNVVWPLLAICHRNQTIRKISRVRDKRL